MEKKFQIFISSTFEDLKEERSEIAKTILEIDCIPSGMEIFCSSSDEQFEIIKKIIDLCDYYVLIIANRYGTIDEKNKISFTELEFNYACSKGIPVLAFFADKSFDKPSDNVEMLNNFKSKVRLDRMISYWKNKDDLAKKVAIALLNAFKKNDRPGWTKAKQLEEEILKTKAIESDNIRLKNELEKVNNELAKANKEIKTLTTVGGNLNFDQKPIEFNYYNYRSYCTKKITLKEIFKTVSIYFIDVSISENALTDYIAKAIDSVNYAYIKDTDLKKVCNQFIALGLFTTRFDKEKGRLFYSLTPKGIKIRDELNLFLLK